LESLLYNIYSYLERLRTPFEGGGEPGIPKTGRNQEKLANNHQKPANPRQKPRNRIEGKWVGNG
jgi:hypothetical protein